MISVFTSALVRGLETGDADLDDDGLISLDELYDYVHQRVRADTPQQSPGRWHFDLQGDITVAYSPKPVSPVELPLELRQAIDSTFVVIREQEVIPELSRLLRGSHRGLTLAAYQALEHVRDHDDSLRVRAAAEEVLA